MLDLLIVGLENQWHTFRLWRQEVVTYYPDPVLWRLDVALRLAYTPFGPFWVARREAKATGLDPTDLTYGETPWATMATIAEKAHVKRGQVLIELGSGTGRALLFACHRFGLVGRGIEAIPTFARRARKLADQLRVHVTFEEGDFFDKNLTGGDLYFVAGTCFSDETIDRMIAKFEKEIPQGARVVTLSYPLDHPSFSVYAEEELPFSWGMGTVFWQVRQ